MGRLNPSTKLTPYDEKSACPWWRSSWTIVDGMAPPLPPHSNRPPQSPVAHEKRLPLCIQPVRAQIRPDQWEEGAGKERCETVWRGKPPRSRTGWPAFGCMAGQTVKGQLLTRVRMRPG